MVESLETILRSAMERNEDPVKLSQALDYCVVGTSSEFRSADI